MDENPYQAPNVVTREKPRSSLRGLIWFTLLMAFCTWAVMRYGYHPEANTVILTVFGLIWATVVYLSTRRELDESSENSWGTGQSDRNL